jgi:CDP-glucose 4,6-dehydratase
MHYLVTGHTGFKGAWLVLLLKSRGHKVSGLSLDPLPGSLFEAANVSDFLEFDFRSDIRDATITEELFKQCSPDVVMHLAAQPLVRYSYQHPRETFETNAMGTLNVLEATSKTPSVRAQLIVTTDKVYKNVNRVDGYKEEEPLGGDDPYSSSKAMADLLTQSWVKSFPGVPTAIGRAGNVIGGGDVSADRLMVDLMQNSSLGIPTEIRSPHAVRPWQHVLDCLNGYLTLVDSILVNETGGEWNFGPGPKGFISVGEIANLVGEIWGTDFPGWIDTSNRSHPHEAELLALDASKAELLLSWSNKLDVQESVEWTVNWTKMENSGIPAREIAHEQIARFETL